MNIRENIYTTEKVPNDTKPINKAVIKFRNHPSVLLIKEKVNNLDNTFSFEKTEINEVIKGKGSLSSKKAGTDNDIRNCKASCATF